MIPSSLTQPATSEETGRQPLAVAGDVLAGRHPGAWVGTTQSCQLRGEMQVGRIRPGAAELQVHQPNCGQPSWERARVSKERSCMLLIFLKLLLLFVKAGVTSQKEKKERSLQERPDQSHLSVQPLKLIFRHPPLSGVQFLSLPEATRWLFPPFHVFLCLSFPSSFFLKPAAPTASANTVFRANPGCKQRGWCQNPEND